MSESLKNNSVTSFSDPRNFPQVEAFGRYFGQGSSVLFSFQKAIEQFNDSLNGSDIVVTKWGIDDPDYEPEYCLLINQTYARRLWLCLQKRTSLESTRITLAEVPWMAQDGTLVFSSPGYASGTANQYVFIMQIRPLPGLYFSRSNAVVKDCDICQILPSRGGKIKIIGTKKNGIKYKYKNRELTIDDIAGLNLYMGKTGKQRMANVLGSSVNNSLELTKQEVEAVTEKMQKGGLPETDFRSLENWRVRLIDEFLDLFFRSKLKHLAAFIKKTIGDKPGGKDLSITQLIPHNIFQKPLRSFFINHPLCQLLDTTNPVASFSQKRRLTFRGPGAPTKKALQLKMRDINATDFGRLCPIETPQGNALGMNLYLATNARINQAGMIETCCVDNSGNEIWADPVSELKEKVKVLAAEKTEDGDGVVTARIIGKDIHPVNASAVTHHLKYRTGFIGQCASLIPFLQHNDANRALMAANMIKQALPLADPEPPLVAAGTEDFFAGQKNGCPFTDNDNHFCLGRNLLVGYMPWDLKNFEDGIVISERLVTSNRLTHIETHTWVADTKIDPQGTQKETITKDNPFLTDELLQTLDDDGVIKKGQKVEPGGLLVSKVAEVNTEKSDPVQALLASILGPRHGKDCKDASIYAPAEMSGTVIDKQWLDRGLPINVLRRVVITVETRHPIQVGDKLTGRHGNKGVVSEILPEHRMPFFKSEEMGCKDHRCKVKDNHTHLEVLLNPLSVIARMNLGQLYETSLGRLARHSGKSLTAAPFDFKWSWETILREMGKENINHKERLYFIDTKGEEQQVEQPVTVGYQYFLKLKHLADHKLRARSRKYYSPVSGQPVAPPIIGSMHTHKRVDFSPGQRSGEMEVWALLGHGARKILDELLYMRSDDEMLRDALSDEIRQSHKHRERIFREIENQAKKRGVKVTRDKNRLTLQCDGKLPEKLVDLLNYHLFRCEHSRKNTVVYVYDPLVFARRRHRSLLTFIKFCRILGLEIKGRLEDGTTVDFEDEKQKYTVSPLVCVCINIIDPDKKHGKEINTIGEGDDGLWSAEIFGKANISHYHLLFKGNGHIPLAEPVDNPLFRPVLEALLYLSGYDTRSIELQRIGPGSASGPIVCNVGEQLEKIVSALDQTALDNWKIKWKSVPPYQTKNQLKNRLVDVLSNIKEEDIDKRLNDALNSEHRFEFFKHAFDPSSEHFLAPDELYKYFSKLDLDDTVREIKEQKVKGYQQALKLIEAMRQGGYKPTDFFIKNLAVLPKDLRVEPPGFNPAENNYKNDFNLFYSEIILQNAKLKQFKQDKNTPYLILRHEATRLQRLVYGLLVNDKMPNILVRPFTQWGNNMLTGKPRESILSKITGSQTSKQGIFRKHLLGKRIDFSSRAVILPDPSLTIDEVGLPQEAGLYLFHDLLVKKALDEMCADAKTSGSDKTSTGTIPLALREQQAILFVENPDNRETIIKWLNDIAKDENTFVLLNRAPSLHRLSTLAFRPVFKENSRTIFLNPYVCNPFNADFDGDTMAAYPVMLPASAGEARAMLPSNCLRSPGHGRLRISHRLDLALGWHLDSSSSSSSSKSLIDEMEEMYKNGQVVDGLKKQSERFRDILNKSGVTLGVDDFLFCPSTKNIQKDTKKKLADPNICDEKKQTIWGEKAKDVEKQLNDCLQKQDDKHPLKRIVQSNAARVDLVQLCGMRGVMLKIGGYTASPVCSNIVGGMPPMDYFHSCHGSRYGLADKGLMTGPAGDLTNILVQAVQAETIVEEDCGTKHGLWLSDFIHPNGDGTTSAITLQARLAGRFLAEDLNLNGEKIEAGTLIDHKKAEKIAAAGITEVKVRTPIFCQAVAKDDPYWNSILKNLEGRKLAKDIPGINFCKGKVLNESDIIKLARNRVTTIEVYAEKTQIVQLNLPIPAGICRKCYGRDLSLSTDEPPEIGHAAGIIAAQSIGEPGTQLTLRTFHTGGTAGQEISLGLRQAKNFFSNKIMPYSDKPIIGGKLKIFISKNGLPWVEIESSGNGMRQRIVNIHKEMRPALPQVEAGQSLGIQPSCTTSGKPLTISTSRILNRFGPAAAAEYMLHQLQIIYNAAGPVADVHFEIVIRKMAEQLTVTYPDKQEEFGEFISLFQYLALKKNNDSCPRVILRTVTQAGKQTPGFLSRLGFRNIRKALMLAALRKETAPLYGLKEKIITGTIACNP